MDDSPIDEVLHKISRDLSEAFNKVFKGWEVVLNELSDPLGRYSPVYFRKEESLHKIM